MDIPAMISMVILPLFESMEIYLFPFEIFVCYFPRKEDVQWGNVSYRCSSVHELSLFNLQVKLGWQKSDGVSELLSIVRHQTKWFYVTDVSMGCVVIWTSDCELQCKRVGGEMRWKVIRVFKFCGWDTQEATRPQLAFRCLFSADRWWKERMLTEIFIISERQEKQTFKKKNLRVTTG